MVEFVGIRKQQAIVAATASDLEQLEHLRQGQPMRVVATFPRSLRHHRWYRGLISAAAEGLDLPSEMLHQQIKFKAGLVSQIVRLDGGGVAVQLKSTSFDAMDESEFTAYAKLAVEILFRDYLPSVRREDVFRHVSEMVGYPCPW